MSRRKLEKAEKILYLILAVVTAGLLIWHFATPPKGKQVEVRVEGKVLGTYALDVDKTFFIGEKGHRNFVVIKDGAVQVTEADCPDKVCVNKGKISRVGESIICLPHRVVIEVTSDENPSGEGEVDVIAK